MEGTSKPQHCRQDTLHLVGPLRTAYGLKRDKRVPNSAACPALIYFTL